MGMDEYETGPGWSWIGMEIGMNGDEEGWRYRILEMEEHDI